MLWPFQEQITASGYVEPLLSGTLGFVLTTEVSLVGRSNSTMCWNACHEYSRLEYGVHGQCFKGGGGGGGAGIPQGKVLTSKKKSAALASNFRVGSLSGTGFNTHGLQMQNSTAIEQLALFNPPNVVLAYLHLHIATDA